MPVHGVQNCKCLQPRVDCFMPTLHPLLKRISLRRTAQHCRWYLSPEWALSPVSIISLNSFKIIQTSQQGGAENCQSLYFPQGNGTLIHFISLVRIPIAALYQRPDFFANLWEEKALPFCCTLQSVQSTLRWVSSLMLTLLSSKLI